MFATAGGQLIADSPLNWSLFFARQPEPDLEFTEEELEQTANIRSSAPMKSPKKSGGRPLLWVLLLLLIGGGAYLAMEPELVMEWVGPLLGETPEPAPPPIARKPAPPKPPVPNPAPSQPESSAAAPSVPPTQPPQTAMPAPAPVQTPAPLPKPTAVPTPTTSSASVPAPPTPVSQTAPALAVPPAVESGGPVFAEGQRVTVLSNPAAPREKVALMQDAAGTKTGPAVPPGTAFTILDGDLQDHGWVYYVRSDYGTKGWLEERQLRLQR